MRTSSSNQFPIVNSWFLTSVLGRAPPPRLEHTSWADVLFLGFGVQDAPDSPASPPSNFPCLTQRTKSRHQAVADATSSFHAALRWCSRGISSDAKDVDMKESGKEALQVAPSPAPASSLEAAGVLPCFDTLCPCWLLE